MLESDQAFVRLGLFLAILGCMAAWEFFAPRRVLLTNKVRRWFVNIGIAALGSAIVPLLYGAAAVGAAMDAEGRQSGLLNQWDLPALLTVPLTLLALDLAIYAQHVASHKIPLLWRLHKVHHSDRDIDASTGIRFHPIEIALSMLYKVGLVYLFGFPPLGVLSFEIMLNGTALFNHANIRLPGRVDAVVRMLFVTPDMHRVHHSTIRVETDSNYGFALSLWDRLFRTYVAQPSKGHENMTIGLPHLQDERPGRFLWTLKAPFRE